MTIEGEGVLLRVGKVITTRYNRWYERDKESRLTLTGERERRAGGDPRRGADLLRLLSLPRGGERDLQK